MAGLPQKRMETIVEFNFYFVGKVFLVDVTAKIRILAKIECFLCTHQQISTPLELELWRV